ncbi:MAG: hypothetical protein HZB38_16880 [Planctomycetes bacterium]|nr:hypothetical protein [Planctomycetota bacterium]
MSTLEAAAQYRMETSGSRFATDSITRRPALATSCRRISCGLTALAFAAASLADVPPPPDSLTEFSAANWWAEADGASAFALDDTSRVRSGSASLLFDTDGAFDTRLWSPPNRDADWDLLAAGSGGVGFWVYAVNNNIGFQNETPWVRLGTTETDYYEYRSSSTMLNSARNQWVYARVPIGGDSAWPRTTVGSPDLAHVRYVEIHADTWEAGFQLWFDGLRLDLPPFPPDNQRAIALNHRVDLNWTAISDPSGTFSSYRVYRDTAPFTSVSGMTPFATITNRLTTSYSDLTAVNDVHYYYAVTARFGTAESVDVPSIGPRTPRDESDLQIISVARTPRYPRYDPQYTYYSVTEPSGFGPYIFSAATSLGSGQNANTRRWPNNGDAVTYTATIRNRGTNNWTTTVTATWRVDGVVVATQSVPLNLAPTAIASTSIQRTWDGAQHEITIDISAADARADNNHGQTATRSVAFLTYADQSYVEQFRENTPTQWPQAQTDDLFDWLNRHMERFNELFAAAGTPKRVHFDVLEMLADGSADPSVPRINFAIFPFRYHVGEGDARLSGYYHGDEDIDYGLLHEMGHQLGLIDIYQLDTGPDQNQVSHTGYSAVADLMHGCSPLIGENSANGMAHWQNTAHGYYGQYLYDMPAEVRLRVLDSAGQPLSGATVTVYQKCERPGLGVVLTDQSKAQGTTDSSGEWVIPNVPINAALVPTTFAGDTLQPNPFGYLAVVGTNGLLLLRVEANQQVDYAWLDVLEVNNAYRAGQTQSATFVRQVAVGSGVQYYPPADLTELNAGDWTSWAQDGTLTLLDDTTRRQVGQASLHVVATGGFDNYVRYPGGTLGLWDLACVNEIRMWVYATNPNGGFQNASPWVRLGNHHDGYIEWHPTWDILNSAIGTWVEFVIPIAGDGVWQRSAVGTPTLGAINYIEIHADTWGAGFDLWLDGVRFSPQPLVGDVNHDTVVNLSDLALLLSNFGAPGGATLEDGDLDGDGDVDISDLALLLSNFGRAC